MQVHSRRHLRYLSRVDAEARIAGPASIVPEWQDGAMDEVTRATSRTEDPGPGPPTGHRARGTVPEVDPQTWWDRLWKPFWAVPAAAVMVSLIAGIVLPRAEESWGPSQLQYVFQGGPDGARGLLGTIASAMISVTGLVFSITMVVLQLASSQFTPRVLGGFLQNRVVQSTLGIFVSTFVFALTVTRSVRGNNETEQFVPQVSVTLAFLMVLGCVGFFLAFIHHITLSIQVSHVISRIGDQTVRLANRMFPEPVGTETSAFGPSWSPEPGTPHRSLEAPRHGVITHVDYAGLLRWAGKRDVVVTLDRPVGQFLTEGQHMLRVWGALAGNGEPETHDLYDLVGLGPQREMRQDVAFGIRQLVDIADRALSPGINDPTTAVRCLDELHRILRLLVQRASPSPYIADEHGQVRVVHHPQAITDLVELAVVEIGHFGRDSVQITPRLLVLLEDLSDVSAERYLTTVHQLLETLKGPEPVT